MCVRVVRCIYGRLLYVRGACVVVISYVYV